MYKKKIITIAFIIISTAISMQAQEVHHSPTNVWTLLINNYKINNKWTINNELHLRYGNVFYDRSAFLFRPSIVYAADPHLNLSLGYSFINNVPRGNSPYVGLQLNEHNIWAQAMLIQQIGKVELQHRFRQEFRWLDKVSLVDKQYQKDGVDYRNRFRYRLTGISTIKKLKNDKSFFAVAFDEIWLNQTNYFKPQSFARNWFFTGLGYRFSKKTNVQLGYMNQWDPAANNAFNSMDIIQAVVVHNL